MSERPIDTDTQIAALESELGRLRLQRACADVDSEIELPVEALVAVCDEFLTAIPATQIEEVTPMSLVSAIPHAPPAVRGTVNYRGVFAPVVDLRYVLTGELTTLTPDMRLVMLRTSARVFALAVDEVDAVRSFGHDDAEATLLVSTLPRYVVHVFRGGQKGIILLHPVRLFAATDADQVEVLSPSKRADGQEEG